MSSRGKTRKGRKRPLRLRNFRDLGEASTEEEESDSDTGTDDANPILHEDDALSVDVNEEQRDELEEQPSTSARPSVVHHSKTDQETFVLFEVEENMEKMIQGGKYEAAIISGQNAKESGTESFRIMVLTVEGYLLGSAIVGHGKIEKSVKDLSKFATGDRFDKLGLLFLEGKSKQKIKALIIFACAAISHARVGQTPNDSSFKTSRSIYYFSDALRKHIKIRLEKESPKKAKLLEEKKFGALGKSIPILLELMKIMYDVLQNIKGVDTRSKYKNEAYALNWIAAACLHFNKYSDTVEYCELGLTIMRADNKCGECLGELQTYGDLLHNIGAATIVNDLESGQEYLKKIDRKEKANDCLQNHSRQTKKHRLHEKATELLHKTQPKVKREYPFRRSCVKSNFTKNSFAVYIN